MKIGFLEVLTAFTISWEELIPSIYLMDTERVDHMVSIWGIATWTTWKSCIMLSNWRYHVLIWAPHIWHMFHDDSRNISEWYSCAWKLMEQLQQFELFLESNVVQEHGRNTTWNQQLAADAELSRLQAEGNFFVLGQELLMLRECSQKSLHPFRLKTTGANSLGSPIALILEYR